MSTEQLQKPDFFEGQYLGAADLDLAVDYNRYQLARHELGAHTWGIASGLALEEVKAVDGNTVNVYVRPGVAIDGYGRQVTVPEPYKIPLEFFTDFVKPAADGEVGMRIRVWIRYVGTPFNSPAPGFENCDADAFSRLQDEFVVEVGPREHDRQHERVVISGAEVHALEVVSNRTDAEPLWCDESIAYQTFPTAEVDRRWLIPLGVVRWDPDRQKLIPTTEEDWRLARVSRRYAGSVTENILASDGLIRIRRRESDPPAPPAALHEACDPLRIDLDADLIYDKGPGDPDGSQHLRVDDLVWVEGNLRVVEISKLLGNVSMHHSEPDRELHIKEAESTADNGLRIENEDNTRNMRLWVGTGGGVVDTYTGANLHLRTEGHDRLFIDNATGNVGIGTTTPNERLEIAGSIRGDRTGAIRIKTPTGWTDVGSKNEAWSHFYTDRTKYYFNREIRVDSGHIGSYNEDLSLRTGGITRITTKLATGDVGIGTTTPNERLEIAGSIRGDQNGAIRIKTPTGWTDVGSKNEDWSHFYTDRTKYYFNREIRVDSGHIGSYNEDLSLRTAGITRITVKSGNGNVGIGTGSPDEKLHVLGSIKTSLITIPSDIRWKKRVKTLEKALDRVVELRAVEFEWKVDEFEDMGFPGGRQIGLVAQEVESVFPELITTSGDGTKSIIYTGFIPVLVEAMKGLRDEVAALVKRIDDMERV